MQFAVDKDDKRVWIENTHSNQAYFCPYCGTELITRKGDIRRHHFAHHSIQYCKDSWIRSNKYDESSWHYKWQNEFPEENREIKIELGQVKHRADVIIGQTVIEFQHSLLSVQDFYERNHFYFDLGYKVIWLFDLSNLYESKRISFVAQQSCLIHSWKNPKECFDAYDVETGTIELFFQINNSDKSIVRVTHVSENGFEQFETTLSMTKEEFLDYVGMKNGNCKSPIINALADKGEYQEFKEKYKINLNPQQERAMLSTEGSVLLLAVPGSGKTTVLVDRLAYMLVVEKIAPNNILALTYNKKACNEMTTRFREKFGSAYNIEFKTINAFALQVYYCCCQKQDKNRRKMIRDRDKNKKLREIYKNISGKKYVSFEDVCELATAISFIKNMQLYGKEDNYFHAEIDLSSVDSTIPNLTQMYNTYQNELKKYQQMDFDDQVYFAFFCLKRNPEILREYRDRYNYICVDEAQDVSKLQHQLINLLAENNNLFMVGDEDQSIYGFRGAYPKALLNFRFDYKNPLILKMETNYRSASEIVSTAQKFISQHTGRYHKKMVAFRSAHGEVKILNVTSRADQYKNLESRIRETSGEVAVLFRNNDSLLPLIDYLEANGISYSFKKPNIKFFEIKSVQVMLAYLNLLANPDAIDSYSWLNNKSNIRVDDTFLNFVLKEIKEKGKTFQDLLSDVDENGREIDQLADLISLDQTIRGHTKDKTDDAIRFIKENCARLKYDALKRNLDQIETLQIIAAAYPKIPDFLKRIDHLRRIYNSEVINSSSKVTLSTIHNAKGLEFETVFVIDVYDGRFPGSQSNILSKSKDLLDAEREDRRLFYVALTRAKDNLFLYSIDEYESTYVNEIKAWGLSNVM